MKAETFNLINHEVKKNLMIRIMDLDSDGKIKVTISNIGSKSSLQRGLDWMWDSEIFKSGKGWADDDVGMTHARGKWLFARPILLRDDYIFSSIYEHFMALYGHNPSALIEFARDYISTERMDVSQVAEYMQNKQKYWLDKGVSLTNPDDYGIKYE